MFIYACVCTCQYVYVHACTCMWRSEVNVSHLDLPVNLRENVVVTFSTLPLQAHAFGGGLNMVGTIRRCGLVGVGVALL